MKAMQRHPLHPLPYGPLLSFALISLCIACDGAQTVSLTAEDFRFAPDIIRVSSSAPLKLSVYNAGREVHEFDSPALVYAQVPQRNDTTEAAGIRLKPGESLELVMAPPPGTYLYICRRKGHADMTGTLIIE
jgi:uncharacterized cupredoxin-like copper-binding protein